MPKRCFAAAQHDILKSGLDLPDAPFRDFRQNTSPFTMCYVLRVRCATDTQHATLSLARLCVERPLKEHYSMQLGVREDVVAAGDDAPNFMRARRLGLAGVEVELARSQLREGRTRLERLKVARDQSGLKVPSLGLGEHNQGGLGSDDAAVAGAAAEDIRQAIEWAAELGAEVILVPFFAAGDLVTEAQVERAALAFRELCQPAQARGVALCYEGNLPAGAIGRLAERVGSPAFGCYFDLANVVWRGMDTATEIERLGGLIHQVHMKDALVGSGDCQPGLGRVDFASSAAA